VVTFTAKDLADPSRQLPRAFCLALGIATTIYVAVALGVFGTLTVDEVIASGGTALTVAAEPVLGRVGYWLMSVTVLFSTDERDTGERRALRPPALPPDLPAPDPPRPGPGRQPRRPSRARRPARRRELR
jgi:hypothetical protein